MVAMRLLVLALGLPLLVQGRRHPPTILLSDDTRPAEDRGAGKADTEEQDGRGPGGRASSAGEQSLSLEALQRLVAGHGRLKTASATRFLMQMYRRLEEGQDLAHASGHTRSDAALQRADTVRSLPAKTDTNGKFSRKTTFRFDLSTISRREATQRAELRIRPTRRQSRIGGSLLYKVRVSVFDGGTRVQKLTFHIRSGNSTSDGFVVLDMTHIIRHVVEAGYHSAIVEVQLKQLTKLDASSEGRTKRSSFPSAPPRTKQEAMLVIFTRDNHFFQNFRLETTRRHLRSGRSAEVSESARLTSPAGQRRRERRSSPRRQVKASAKGCQVQDLYVDFNQIGWGEWIVYPKRFNAYQCTGRCPVPVDQSYDPTNHAVLQSLMRVRERGAGAARPCCVPAKLRAITMLYYEQEVVVVRHHEDMVVDACACR